MSLISEQTEARARTTLDSILLSLQTISSKS